MSAPEMLDEEETRSVTAREVTKAHLLGDQVMNNCHSSTKDLGIYMNMTNNFFELGSSSLLVEQGVRPGGLFAPGDRLIPFRPEESQF